MRATTTLWAQKTFSPGVRSTMRSSTRAMGAVVDKGRIIGTTVIRVNNVPISIQAFQRTILTYDPENPAGFEVERANTGTEYSRVFPDRVPQPAAGAQDRKVC